MGYVLQALIGKRQTLVQNASDRSTARIVPLAQDLAMIPVTDDLYAEVGEGGDVDRFHKLSPGIVEWARRISVSAPVAYVEAEYFGGTGGQSAAAWAGGLLVFGPIHAEDAINQALRCFGVRTDDAHDEFDAIGLGLRRRTEDWLLAGTP